MRRILGLSGSARGWGRRRHALRHLRADDSVTLVGAERNCQDLWMGLSRSSLIASCAAWNGETALDAMLHRCSDPRPGRHDDRAGSHRPFRGARSRRRRRHGGGLPAYLVAAALVLAVALSQPGWVPGPPLVAAGLIVEVAVADERSWWRTLVAALRLAVVLAAGEVGRRVRAGSGGGRLPARARAVVTALIAAALGGRKHLPCTTRPSPRCLSVSSRRWRC